MTGDADAMFEAEALRCTENAERLLGRSERESEDGQLSAAQAQVWATLAVAWRTAEQTNQTKGITP